MIRDLIDSFVVLVLAPFRLAGEVLAVLFGFAKAGDVEWLDGAYADKADVGNLRDELEKIAREVPQLRTLLDAIDKELHPPPPKTLAERLAEEHGIDCKTCEAILAAAKEAP